MSKGTTLKTLKGARNMRDRDIASLLDSLRHELNGALRTLESISRLEAERCELTKSAEKEYEDS